MKIPCTNCNQHLEIPEELAGQTIECPTCKASLSVPESASNLDDTEIYVPLMKQQFTRPQTATTPPKAASSKKSKSLIPKLAIAAIAGVVVVVLIMFFSGGSNYEQAGGFSFVPPSGWQEKDMPGMKFKIWVGQPEKGFAPNIVVVDEQFDGSLNDYVNENIKSLNVLFQKIFPLYSYL